MTELDWFVSKAATQIYKLSLRCVIIQTALGLHYELDTSCSIESKITICGVGVDHLLDESGTSHMNRFIIHRGHREQAFV